MSIKGKYKKKFQGESTVERERGESTFEKRKIYEPIPRIQHLIKKKRQGCGIARKNNIKKTIFGGGTGATWGREKGPKEGVCSSKVPGEKKGPQTTGILEGGEKKEVRMFSRIIVGERRGTPETWSRGGGSWNRGLLSERLGRRAGGYGKKKSLTTRTLGKEEKTKVQPCQTSKNTDPKM